MELGLNNTTLSGFVIVQGKLLQKHSTWCKKHTVRKAWDLTEFSNGWVSIVKKHQMGQT